MGEVHKIGDLIEGHEYEVDTIHTFRGRFIGYDMNGSTKVAIFETGGRGAQGKPSQRWVPQHSFRRAAD